MTLAETVDLVLERLRAAPHSASALTLYALASTLDHEEAGCLFRLEKLRDVDPEDRGRLLARRWR